jgi:hypothetical protein
MLTFSLVAMGATPDEVFRSASRSVVVVQVQNSHGELLASGSGVVIAPGRVATNCHVVRSDRLPDHGVYMVGVGRDLRNAVLARSSDDADVCILQVQI